jgi:hypothetical protein
MYSKPRLGECTASLQLQAGLVSIVESSGTSLLEQVDELALLGLQVRVATNVLLGDEDVGDGRLAGHVGEDGLHGGAIVCGERVSGRRHRTRGGGGERERGERDGKRREKKRGALLTNLVELDSEELCALVAQQLLCLAAVGAVALGEDGDGILVDDGLDLCLCGGHCGGTGSAREVAAQEENGGGVGVGVREGVDV